ncbi:MAG: M23 family metallopeptidase [Gammaproteobacteria bacterium]|nr:M23 family metallopeptidase [Gammaproteobacteria bacterium]
MNILFLTKCHTRSRCLNLGRNGVVVAAIAIFIILPLAGGLAGYHIGIQASEPHALSAAWAKEMEAQRAAIDEAQRVAQENLNALALRLGQMQAHVIRLDALGQRLTRMANLEDGEFDFENPPGQGGPVTTDGPERLEIADFIAQLGDLSQKLDDRGQQLDVLETMLINRNMQAEVFPAGRPAKGGWISSYFGIRSDPFTGRPHRHNGIDLAGKEGSEVIAVASGVVTWAGERYGYGNLVEVTHGNGYVTRYGHNKDIVVQLGEPVRKGQTVATMGSTGRSTGPHIHFEVLRNGVHVDPLSYIQAAR